MKIKLQCFLLSDVEIYGFYNGSTVKKGGSFTGRAYLSLYVAHGVFEISTESTCVR